MVIEPEGRTVAFAADGIHDELALTVGDAGIAIFDVGKVVAVRSAEIVLLSDC
jgi:cation transport ATPase